MSKRAHTEKTKAARQRMELIARAESGDVDAQCSLGDVYRAGDGVTPQDYAEALRWYRQSAEQADPNAANNLGAMYEHGMGAAKDMVAAATLYRRAAQQGLATAQFNLTLCLLNGTGVPRDESEAAEWLHKAAPQGHIDSIAQLGTLYQLGVGVERRIPTAAEYHTIAALAGEVESAVRLQNYREELETDALRGSMLAALCLAKICDRGLGAEVDKPAMYAWLQLGEKYGACDDDADVREELIDMRGFYGITLPDADKDAASELLAGLVARRSSINVQDK
jgi:TPR repeat protein